MPFDPHSGPGTNPFAQSQGDWAIEISGLSKLYATRNHTPARQALSGIDLAIPKGCLFGLLGPNGAGKSTLINILAGLVNKTAGQARIWGYDIIGELRAARSSIGVVPQELNLDPFFTPAELLDLQAGLYGVPKSERRTQELLAAVGLADKANAYARTLSGGMRRRLMVAKALVHTPPVLILDEPTAGVDVELRRSLWEYVRTLNRAGTTILLTTHYLEEAEELCDRIAIIDQGRLVANEPTRTLIGRIDSKTLTLVIDRDMTELPAVLESFDATLPSARQIVIRYQPSRQPIGPILAALAEAGIGILDLSTDEADLEDIFLQLTRRESQETA